MVETVLPGKGIFAGPSQDGSCIRHITVRHKTNNNGKRERERKSINRKVWKEIQKYSYTHT